VQGQREMERQLQGQGKGQIQGQREPEPGEPRRPRQARGGGLGGPQAPAPSLPWRLWAHPRCTAQRRQAAEPREALGEGQHEGGPERRKGPCGSLPLVYRCTLGGALGGSWAAETGTCLAVLAERLLLLAVLVETVLFLAVLIETLLFWQGAASQH